MSLHDYENEYWPKLSDAIKLLLVNLPGKYIPLSYEQMYSCVYKCVCSQFSERLYSDVRCQVTEHLEALSQNLSFDTAAGYIINFNSALDRYIQSLHAIVPVFNYLNRFYIEAKLKTDLNTELTKLFINTVSDRHIDMLIPLLDEVHLHPFSVQPAVMASLVKNLYAIKPEYAQKRVQLFARYIPNILPPCSLEELQHYAQEARQMTRDLLTHPEFISGDQTRKRLIDLDGSMRIGQPVNPC